MTTTTSLTTSEFDAAVKHVEKIYMKDFLLRIYLQINKAVAGVEIDSSATERLLMTAKAHFGAKKTIPKELAAILFVKVFNDAQVLQLFIAQLPENVRRIFDMIAWRGPQSVGELEKEIGGVLSQDVHFSSINNHANRELYESRPYMFLQPDLQIFEIQKPQSYYYYNVTAETIAKFDISLPAPLLRMYRAIFPMPKELDLCLLDAPPDAEYYYEGEGDIEESGGDVFEYIREGYVDYTNAGKPKKTSVRKMRDFFTIKEFYPVSDKTWDLVRTDMLVFLFSELPTMTTSNGLNIIREVIGLMNGKCKHKDRLFSFYFKHIRNTNYSINFQSEHTSRALEVLHSAFRLLPPGQWVEAENFLDHIIATDRVMPYFDKEFTLRYCNLVVVDTDKYGYQSREEFSMTGARQKEFMIRPMVYTYAVVLAALGLADICYTEPVGWIESKSTKSTEIIFAAGLRGIRLNDLGAYILGITNEYTSKQVKKNKVTIELDPERLIAVMSGDDPLLSAFLGKFGEKISDRHYRMSHTSVISDCSSSTEIARKVEQFTEKLGKNIPQNWQDFLSSFADRTDVLVPVEGYVVFTIKGDTALLGLLARDAVLQKYIVKVEGRRVAIEHQHWTKVRNRLKELGYFMRSGS